MQNVLLRLREILPSLSSTERQIARYILENPDETTSLTVRELAGRTFSSPSSVVRICRAVGFRGYKELRHALILEMATLGEHGSHPEQGENAIGRLVCYLDRLPLEGDAKQAVHFLAEKLGTDPYGERLLGHRLEDALSGPMSCNWGLIEGDAQHLWVKLNYRYPVTMERANCQPAVQAAFEAAGWALDGQVHKEKLYYPAETPLVSALLEVYRDATGDNAPPKCIGGGTYAKMLPNVVAFGPLFAGDPVTEHQPDECIDLERLVQNAQIIANAIVKLANLPLE